MQLFSLHVGAKFKYTPESPVYEVKRYFYQRRPMVGRVLILESKDEQGNIQRFMRNKEVEFIPSTTLPEGERNE